MADLETIQQVLKLMGEAELAMAELYQTCADAWPEDNGFWKKLAAGECEHSANMRRMGEIIALKFDRFQLNRPINPVGIRTFISGIRSNIDRVKSGAIPKRNMLFIARDIENSILEIKYNELVRSDDVEFNTLIKRIVDETHSHLRMMGDQIAKLPQS